MLGRVPAVGTVTRKVFALEPGAKLDLEIALAIGVRALPTGEAVFVGLNRDCNAIAKTSEMIRQENLPAFIAEAEN